MKSIAVVCVLALAAVALAADVPTLPGLASPCLPHRKPVNVRWQHRFEKEAPPKFKGTCVRDSSCAPLNTVHGYCACMGVVCCKGGAQSVARPLQSVRRLPVLQSSAPRRPILRSSAPATCAGLRGTCMNVALCKAPNQASAHLCPGAASNMCCHPAAAVAPVTPPPVQPSTALVPTAPGQPTPFIPPGGSLTQLIVIPPGINKGLNFPSASFQTSILGTPGCALTPACFTCGCASSARIKKLVVTMKVTDTVSVTGIAPFVKAVKAAFDMMATGTPDAQLARKSVKYFGGLCCRPIKRPNGTAAGTWSNHSWGMAVDFSFASLDPRGDGKCQRGLAVMGPYFNAQGLYWAAGYKGADEDSMHFEASVGLVQKWKAAGLLN